MTATDPQLFTHPDRPAWGRCVLVSEREGKLFLQGEDGAEHVVAATHRGKLSAMSVAAEEARAIAASIQGRKPASSGAARKKPKSGTSRTPAAPRVGFDEQIRRFEHAYPGGFLGERFTTEERGIVAGAPKSGEVQAAIERARELLAPAAFADPATAVQAAQALLAATDLVHPMEGAIPFKSLPPELHAEFAAALSDLLHGSGDSGPRFGRFVESLKLTDAKGVAKRPAWPLSTLFAALYHPGAEAFIKPKLLQEQAGILGLSVAYKPLPDALVYEQFRRVIVTLRDRLIESGQQPRDLFDAAAFVWTTLAPGAAIPVPAE